jgi:glycosyltransferase involved in cell wall biosynthesis
MKTLLIGPLPPPVSGNALNTKTLYDELKSISPVDVINLSKKKHNSGVLSVDRVIDIINALQKLLKKGKVADIIYLIVAESFLGNIRDLIIYLFCRKRLNSLVIHMLGGAGMKDIISKRRGIRFWINKYFLSRLGAIIVEGKTQFDMFSEIADPEKIKIIPNFADDYLFLTEKEVSNNFNKVDPLRILFLSNMLYGKGHMELLEAYLKLDEKLKDKVVIDFAGKLVSKKEERIFLNKIRESKNINYHGPVSGLHKKNLYSKAHVFCLPTYYPFEGQPFCILEAYATGCVVITTNHSGIRNVFRDRMNGFEVEKRSVESLVSTLERVITERNSLRSIAIENLKSANEKYTKSRYLASIKRVFNSLQTP